MKSNKVLVALFVGLVTLSACSSEGSQDSAEEVSLSPDSQRVYDEILRLNVKTGDLCQDLEAREELMAPIGYCCFKLRERGVSEQTDLMQDGFELLARDDVMAGVQSFINECKAGDHY